MVHVSGVRNTGSGRNRGISSSSGGCSGYISCRWSHVCVTSA